MIRRINKLRNVGLFVELRSRGGNQNEFTKLNVIYALNACGKTTLCDVFRSLGTGNPDYIHGRKRFGSTNAVEIEFLLDGSPTPRVVLSDGEWEIVPAGSNAPRTLVYDDRFVADNVLVGQFVAVEQRRNLYGLALGAKGRVLKEKVDAVGEELSNATSVLNNTKSLLTALIPTGFTIDNFRSIAKDDAIDQRIKDATEALDTVKRAQQNADSIRQRKAFGVSPPPAVPEGIAAALEATLNDAALQAEAYIRQHLERHSRGLGLDWVGRGFKAQTGTTCPHCGQEMDGLEILAAYRAFFSGVLQEQQAALSRIVSEVEERFGPIAQERLEQLINSHVVEKDWWRDAGGSAFDLPPCQSIEMVRTSMEGVRAAIVGAVQRKQAQPAQRIVLSEDESADISLWAAVSASIRDYMAALSPINATIAERQRTAGTIDVASIEKQIVVLIAQKKRHEPVVVDAYRAFDTAIANKAGNEKAKTEANTALRDQSELVLREYGNRINSILERFGVNFRLVSGGVNFHGGPPAGELAIEILGTRVSTSPEDARHPSRPSLANTLSSGDRSALGLAFFVAVAERDPNISDTIVVFDDPFHSQDRSRRRRTIECVHRVASASSQCFILSHELDFAREAARLAGVLVNTFTLNAMKDHCMLEAASLPSLPSRAYERDYAKLTAYLDDPGNFTNQLKDVTRCIRQTLECYLRTKFPESWEDSDWIGGMIGKIRDAQPSDVLHHAVHLVDELTEVNEWGKRYYHGETDGSDASAVDPVELKGYVNQTIGIISS